MQKHPLLSVKEAAAILRLDERSVRERLINGQLKGEKKTVGLREKWFVYSGSVETARSKDSTLANDVTGFADVTVESEPVEQDFNPHAVDEPVHETDDAWIELNRDRVKILAEEIVKPLMDKIENQTEVIFEQKRTIEEQERQLRLLPDLQKLAESERLAAESTALQVEALKKQIAAIQTQQIAASEKERKAAEENEQAWKQQISALKEKQAAAIEQERRAAEAANREMERVKSEKEIEAKAIQEQLTALTDKLQKLELPWWKKWFSSGNQ